MPSCGWGTGVKSIGRSKLFARHTPARWIGAKARLFVFMEKRARCRRPWRRRLRQSVVVRRRRRRRKKKKKKQTKKLDAGTRVKQEKAVAESFTFYARFEEIVEDWKLQSDVGQRALVELASLLPSIPHMNEEFRDRTEDQRANYPTTANKIEDLFGIFSKSVYNLKVYVAEMEDILKEYDELLRSSSATRIDIEEVLLYRGESNCKCSPSDWYTIILAEYGMIRRDIEMKCEIYEKIVNKKIIDRAELTLLCIKWRTKPFVDGDVLDEIQELIKLDHVAT